MRIVIILLSLILGSSFAFQMRSYHMKEKHLQQIEKRMEHIQGLLIDIKYKDLLQGE